MSAPVVEALELARSGDWLTVWFNDPGARNPLSAARARDLLAVCDWLAAGGDGVRGVTFRGRGAWFCAGGDLKAMGAMFAARDRVAIEAMSREGAALFDAVDALPQVTVMAVEGAAMAGGFGLACCGDVVIVDRAAKFGFSETAIGLSPAQIAPFVLRRLGQRVGRRLLLTAERFTGAEAAALGFADAVTEGAGAMDAEIARVAARVGALAPGAVADTKALIRALPGLSRDEQVAEAARVFADRLMSDEGAEGVRAFAEKRKPNWAEGA